MMWSCKCIPLVSKIPTLTYNWVNRVIIYNLMVHVYQFSCGRSVVFSGYSTLVSSTNKTDQHDIAEILLKVALNTITLTLYVFSVSVGTS